MFLENFIISDVIHSLSTLSLLCRVSTTPGYILEFEIASGNTGNSPGI